MRERDKALKYAVKHPLEENLVWARAVRTRTNNAVNFAYAEYIKALLKKYGRDPKKFWKVISDLLPKSLKKPPIHLLDQNEVPIPKQEVAEKINSFFSEVGPRLAAAIPPLPPNPPLPPLKLHRRLT